MKIVFSNVHSRKLDIGDMMYEEREGRYRCLQVLYSSLTFLY